MRLKALSGIMQTLLVIGMLTLTFNIQPAKASGTIYIRVDGSVDPSTANITSVDNVTYIFTGSINGSIVVEKSNVIIDGKGYTVQGTGSGSGISLSGRSNVTIKNTNIKDFRTGIYLNSASFNVISVNSITNNYSVYRNCIGIYLRDSPNNSISENNIINNDDSIMLDWSLNNSISENNITNNGHGIYLYDSKYNSISENDITNNANYGIALLSSLDNTISGNNMAANAYGIWIGYSLNNTIYHNNFVNNAEQVYSCNSTNVWDNEYPSGGNYWSDCTAVDADGDGIGDTYYVIDGNNTDRYPLMEPWSSKNTSDGATQNFFDKLVLLAPYIGLVLTIILVIVATAFFVRHKKKQ